jgi:hypothetical protein
MTILAVKVGERPAFEHVFAELPLAVCPTSCRTKDYSR